MMLAEVTFDGDLNTYAWEFLTFLLLLGGAVFFLATLARSQTPVASGLSPARKRGERQDAFSTPSLETDPLKQVPLTQSQRCKSGGNARNKRSSLRRHGNPVPVLVSDSLAGPEPVQGAVVDRSRGGLRLSLSHPVDLGRVLAVRTAEFPEDLASVQLRVRHCKQKGETWYLGCQFVEEYPWSVLLMFG